ncbi:MAG: RHS repeat-associated core domain-containing protein, partial [Candidatus Muiribacteriota bacterium]
LMKRTGENQIRYIYDKNGKLTAVTTKEEGIGREATPSNEELTTHYFYDKQGNLIMTKGRENKKYEYDAFNQLKAVNRVEGYRLNELKNPSNSSNSMNSMNSSNSFISFEYSPLGWRESKTVKTSEENYTEKYYYLGANIFETRKENLSSLRRQGTSFEYTSVISGPGIDEIYGILRSAVIPDPVQETSATNELYFIRDYLGNIKSIFDENGNMLYYRLYDEFGGESGQSRSQDYTDQNDLTQPCFTSFGFTSREFDEIADLYFYRSRYYDPILGRFTQRDKFNEAGFITGNPAVIYNPLQLNDYTYVGNNPLIYTDPWGFCKEPRIVKLPFNYDDSYAFHIKLFPNTIFVTPKFINHSSKFVQESLIFHEKIHIQQSRNRFLEDILFNVFRQPKYTEIEAHEKEMDYIEKIIKENNLPNSEKFFIMVHIEDTIKPQIKKYGGGAYPKNPEYQKFIHEFLYPNKKRIME